MVIDGRSESPSAVDILNAVERLQRACFSVAPGRVAVGAGRKEKVYLSFKVKRVRVRSQVSLLSSFDFVRTQRLCSSRAAQAMTPEKLFATRPPADCRPAVPARPAHWKSVDVEARPMNFLAFEYTICSGAGTYR